MSQYRTRCFTAFDLSLPVLNGWSSATGMRRQQRSKQLILIGIRSVNLVGKQLNPRTSGTLPACWRNWLMRKRPPPEEGARYAKNTIEGGAAAVVKPPRKIELRSHHTFPHVSLDSHILTQQTHTLVTSFLLHLAHTRPLSVPPSI